MQGLRSEREFHQHSVFADRASSEFAAPALRPREHFTTSPGANDVPRRFNGDTRWVARGLLGILLLAALLFVILFPEDRAMTAGAGHGVAIAPEKGTRLDQPY